MTTSKDRGPALVEGRPPKLTDFGKDVESFMDSCGWCNQAYRAAASKVRCRRVSREALRREAHKLSRRYVYSRLSPMLKENVKKCARVKGTTVENVRRVLVVVLRDTLRDALFLKKRLEGW